MRKNYLSLAIYPPHWLCSLYHQSVFGAGSQQQSSSGAACAPLPSCTAVDEEQTGSLAADLQTGGVGVLRWGGFTSLWFWQPSTLLLFLLICSVRPVHILCVASLALCHCVLCIFTSCPICSVFSPGRSRFLSQEFLPSSDSSICSWLNPEFML